MTHPTEPAHGEFHRPAWPGGNSQAAALREARDRQAESLRHLAKASDRARFWFAVRIALTCVGGCVLGFVPMAWALHTTDIEAGMVAWAVGPVLGQVIVLSALVYGAVRWSRDEW